MNRPELLIIPVMMLLDYFLTVSGAILSEKEYRRHYKIEHYELNPLWQKNIARKQWLNPKHLAVVVVVILFCFIWSNSWTEPDSFSEGFFGFVVVFNASIIGTHLSNIFTFLYVNRHPESLSGEIKISHPMMLNLSQFQAFRTLFILIVIWIFSPTPFIIGGVCSQIALLCIKGIWLAKTKAAQRNRIPPKISDSQNVPAGDPNLF